MRLRYHWGPAMSGGDDGAGRGPGWSWRLIVSMRRAYGVVPEGVWHPLANRTVVAATAVTAIATWQCDWRAGALLAVLEGGSEREPERRGIAALEE